MKDKLIKVTFEYEDRIETLEKPTPEEWLKSINSCIGMSTIHGSPMIDNNWKVDKK